MVNTGALFGEIMARNKHRVPDSVLRRFVQYHGLLRMLRLEGREWVSSQALAEALGLTSSTVRQDLLHLDYLLAFLQP